MTTTSKSLMSEDAIVAVDVAIDTGNLADDV